MNETNTQTGCFISLEGSEGAGKSTSLDYIKQWFAANKLPVLVTREPGGTPFAEQIRDLLLANRDEQVQPLSELLLMYAGRIQHVEQLIKPTLASGQWVISDRFNDASFAYQGYGRGTDIDKINQLDRWSLNGFKPQLTLFLDLPVEIGMQRAIKRGAPDRFEKEHISFFENVRQGYLSRAQADPDRVKIIDAAKTIPEVEQQIAELLKSFVYGKSKR